MDRKEMEVILELVTGFSRAFIDKMTDEELLRAYKDRIGERDEVLYGESKQR